MANEVRNGCFKSSKGKFKKKQKNKNYYSSPRWPFDTREFVNDVCEIQKSVKDEIAARDLVVLTIRMIKESLRVTPQPQEMEL